MLTEIADGVLVHQSATLESNAVVVRGDAGLLLVDPGLTSDELSGLASDLRRLGQPVVAGFATHPHWDHVLWHDDFGDAPRYGSELCASELRDLFASPAWRDRVAGALPPEIADAVPIDDLFGQVTALSAATIPWDGPVVRLIEHQGHARGHAALVIESSGVLIAGDMLSDKFVPILSRAESAIDDYLDALDLLQAAGAVVVVPGHGSVGTDVQNRIDLDRAYVLALRDGNALHDPRVDTPQPGWDWVRFIHEGQVERYGAAST